MYPTYRDIRTKLGAPLWTDQYGVPRYDEFSPELASEIYDDWVALLEVKCQSCEKVFTCSTCVAKFQMVIKRKDIVTEEDIISQLIGWGDAPWHTFEGDEASMDGQCAGTTMTTSVIGAKVWRKDRFDWIEVDRGLYEKLLDAEEE